MYPSLRSRRLKLNVNAVDVFIHTLSHLIVCSPFAMLQIDTPDKLNSLHLYLRKRLKKSLFKVLLSM